MITETWLYSNILDGTISTKLHNLAIRKKPQSREIKTWRCFDWRTFWSGIRTNFLDGIPAGMLVACIVTMGEHRVLLVCLYHPPNDSPYFMAHSPLNILFEDVLKYSSQVTSIIIYGDFNLADIDWKVYSSATPDNQAFIDLMMDNDLIQIIDFPTAASGILDLIFISKDLYVSSCKVGDGSINLLSNHFSI